MIFGRKGHNFPNRRRINAESGEPGGRASACRMEVTTWDDAMNRRRRDPCKTHVIPAKARPLQNPDGRPQTIRVSPAPRGKCATQSNYGYDVAEGRRGHVMDALPPLSFSAAMVMRLIPAGLCGHGRARPCLHRSGPAPRPCRSRRVPSCGRWWSSCRPGDDGFCLCRRPPV